MSWWHILNSINACLTAKWQISSWSLITHDRFKQNTFLVQIRPMLPTIKAQNEQKPNRPVQLIQPLFIQACNSSSVGRYVGEYVMVCLVRITILSPNPIFHTVWPLPPTQCPQLECWLWWTVGRSSRWGHCISGYGCRRSICSLAPWHFEFGDSRSTDPAAAVAFANTYWLCDSIPCNACINLSGPIGERLPEGLPTNSSSELNTSVGDLFSPPPVPTLLGLSMAHLQVYFESLRLITYSLPEPLVNRWVSSFLLEPLKYTAR